MSDYHTDFFAWTQVQSHFLRNGDWRRLDQEHLAEEIEDLGKRERRAIESHLENTLLHLLKWRYQPQRRGRSWQRSLLQARHRLPRLLQDNPSLDFYFKDFVARAYPYARRLAALETGLALETFPEGCPWSRDQILNPDFLPDAPPHGV